MIQSMPGRHWWTSVNSHVHPRLHEWFLLLIWICTCDPRFLYPQKRVSCCWSMPNISFRIKTGYNRVMKAKWQSLVLQLRQHSSYLAWAIVRLIMMLARAIFRSCGGFGTCVDTRTCDRTCLRAWIAHHKHKQHFNVRHYVQCTMWTISS